MMKYFNSLADAFSYYTECQLATLETLKHRKSTSKYELDRQNSIAQDMIDSCVQFDVDGILHGSTGTPRLNKILQERIKQ